MTPGELAAAEQAEHDSRMAISRIGTSYRTADGHWYTQGWRVIDPAPDAPAEPITTTGDSATVDEEVANTGWTSRDLIEISLMETTYCRPSYDREAGE